MNAEAVRSSMNHMIVINRLDESILVVSNDEIIEEYDTKIELLGSDFFSDTDVPFAGLRSQCKNISDTWLVCCIDSEEQYYELGIVSEVSEPLRFSLIGDEPDCEAAIEAQALFDFIIHFYFLAKWPNKHCPCCFCQFTRDYFLMMTKSTITIQISSVSPVTATLSLSSAEIEPTLDKRYDFAHVLRIMDQIDMDDRDVKVVGPEFRNTLTLRPWRLIVSTDDREILVGVLHKGTVIQIIDSDHEFVDCFNLLVHIINEHIYGRCLQGIHLGYICYNTLTHALRRARHTTGFPIDQVFESELKQCLNRWKHRQDDQDNQVVSAPRIPRPEEIISFDD